MLQQIDTYSIDMRLVKIDNAISTCEQHLSSTGAGQSEIESYLTRYLLILICATFEEEIKNILLKRSELIDDQHIKSFFQHCINRVFRSIKSSEIAGILGCFGSDYKELFQEKANGTIEETFYNNIITNRHFTAHSTGALITFRELVNYYEKGHLILDYLDEALCS